MQETVSAGYSQPRPDLRALTGIRFFAAFYVLLFHSKFPQYLAAHHQLRLASFIGNGDVAVQLFFVLSGFILAYGYYNRIGEPGGVRAFWEARWARIWPLYALSLLLCSVVNHTTPHALGAISTVLMLQSWNPLTTETGGLWNSVCWTLSCEAFFYLVFPIIQGTLKNLRNRLIFLVMGGALGIAVWFALCKIAYSESHVPMGIPLAVARLPDFLAGVCLGNIFLRAKPGLSAKPVAWLTWSGAIGAAFVLAHPQRSIVGWSIVFFCCLLYGLSTERSALRSVLSSRLLQIGGAASYSMYLMQWPVKTLAFRVCDRLHISMNGKFAIFVVALTAVSWALFVFVEEPAREAIRSGFGLGRSYFVTRQRAALVSGAGDTGQA